MGSSAGMMGSGCSEGWPTGPAALNTEARRQPPPDDWRSHLRATGSGSRAHQRLLPAVHQRAHLLGSEGRHRVDRATTSPQGLGFRVRVGLCGLSPTCLMTASTSQDP